jgi:hypothetical protein
MLQPTMRVPKIDPHRSDLPSLMNLIRTGNIRIPGFQRDFVWEPKRIQTLLDSMCKEYPIGTIFLWKAPSEYNHLLRNLEVIPQPPLEQGQQYDFLLDGQQRLTSLYVTINGLTVGGEDYSKIAIDLENDKPNEPLFSKRQRIDNKRYVAVKDLLALSTTSITRALPDDLVSKFELYRTILYTYPFSVVTVSDMKIDDAIVIFERINRQGRRLDRYDLIAASVFTKDFDLRKRTDADIQNIASDTFGEIPSGTITQLLALVIKGNAETQTQLSLNPKDVENNWQGVVKAIFLALDLLQRHFGVASVELLPYDAILPVLSYYYFVNRLKEPSKDHLLQLEQWFWSATFSDRYSGSSQTLISDDAGWIRNLVRNETGFSEKISADLGVLIDARITRTTSSVRNGYLCVLNLQRPLDFENGSEINMSEFNKLTGSNRYRIFPLPTVPDGISIQSIMNFCFIPARVAEQFDIPNSAPSQYMQRIKSCFSNSTDFDQIMASHLIPVGEDSGIWSDDYPLFLEQRAKLVLARIYQLSGIGQEISEDDPVLNTLETGLRNEIHNRLETTFGPNYWVQIPNHIASSVTKRIQTDATKSVQDISSILNNPQRCLDYLNPGDYLEIIRANQPAFALHDFAQWERYLKDWQDYRNTTKHNRRADTLLSARGLGACIWLSRVLSVDLSQYGVF